MSITSSVCKRHSYRSTGLLAASGVHFPWSTFPNGIHFPSGFCTLLVDLKQDSIHKSGNCCVRMLSTKIVANYHLLHLVSLPFGMDCWSVAMYLCSYVFSRWQFHILANILPHQSFITGTACSGLFVFMFCEATEWKTTLSASCKIYFSYIFKQ